MNNRSTDQDIKSLLQKSPDKAVELLFQDYFAYVCTVVYQFIPNGQIAEDIAQDLFFDIWKKRKSIHFSGSVKAYLRRSAINRSMNYLRDKKPELFEEPIDQEDIAMPSVKPERLTETKELEAQIDAAILSLPERCRLIFSLSRFEDLTYKEIAHKLGISEKTVENQIVKALKLLRAKLGPYLSIILLIFPII